MVDDIYTRQWIIEHAQDIISNYPEGMTVRQLHYRLVSIGMINDLNHYKRVVGAMTKARWDGIVSMQSFVDRERSMYGSTEAEEKDVDNEIENGKSAIESWMTAYFLDRWSNQDKFVEVWIEKKALQGVFERPCRRMNVALAPCKGYPSITFINKARHRFEDAIDKGKEVVILYFGDYDPSGADIPRSLEDNLNRMGVDVTLIHCALNQKQIQELGLPGVPPKRNDTRTNGWSGGDVVELDAVEPRLLAEMCSKAIEEHFSRSRYNELNEREAEERKIYQDALKEYVNSIGDEEDD